jgi:hypothetical protein
MILDSIRCLFNEHASAIAEKYAHNDYGRMAGLSVIVNAEEMFDESIVPAFRLVAECNPLRPDIAYAHCVDLLHELIDDLKDPQWQDHLLNITLAGIASEVEIYRGGEVDLPPLQKIISDEVNDLESAIKRAITIQGLLFVKSPK